MSKSNGQKYIRPRLLVVFQPELQANTFQQDLYFSAESNKSSPVEVSNKPQHKIHDLQNMIIQIQLSLAQHCAAPACLSQSLDYHNLQLDQLIGNKDMLVLTTMFINVKRSRWLESTIFQFQLTVFTKIRIYQSIEN